MLKNIVKGVIIMELAVTIYGCVSSIAEYAHACDERNKQKERDAINELKKSENIIKGEFTIA